MTKTQRVKTRNCVHCGKNVTAATNTSVVFRDIQTSVCSLYQEFLLPTWYHAARLHGNISHGNQSTKPSILLCVYSQVNLPTGRSMDFLPPARHGVQHKRRRHQRITLREAPLLVFGGCDVALDCMCYGSCIVGSCLPRKQQQLCYKGQALLQRTLYNHQYKAP